MDENKVIDGAEIPNENPDPVKEEQTKTIGEWLKECPIGKKTDKPKKKGRIVAMVCAGLAVLGTGVIMLLSKGEVNDEIPELTDAIDGEPPFEVTDEVAEVVETITE